MKALSIPIKVLIFTLLSSIYTSSFAFSVIANPDFESGSLSPWYQWFDNGNLDGIEEDWHITDLDAHTGQYSATAVAHKGIRQDFAPLLTDNITEITFWLKHPSITTQFNVSTFVFFYGDSTFSQVALNSSGTQDWTYYDVISDVLSGKMLTGVGISGYKSTDVAIDRIFLDDLAISSVPLPPAIWLFGSGLLGLVGVARKKAAGQ